MTTATDRELSGVVAIDSNSTNLVGRSDAALVELNQCENSNNQGGSNTRARAEVDGVVVKSPPTTTTTSSTRRSSRDTNRIVLKSVRNGSLPFRRMEELFFNEADLPRRRRHRKAKNQHNQQQSIISPPSPPPVIVRLGKFLLERVYQAPNIYVIENFLTPNDLEYLHQTIHNCQRQFQRSYVDRAQATTDNNTNESILDETHRTSTFLSFSRQENAKVAAIEQRAAQLLGYYSTDQIEPLQLVRYLPNQFFGVHHDMGDLDENTGKVALPPKNVLVKRRLVTIFCYLNDMPSPQAGGCTYFPCCDNLRVEPKKGRAVVFCNTTAEGKPDPRTIHAGERVVDTTTNTSRISNSNNGQDNNNNNNNNNENGNQKKRSRKQPPVKYGLNIWVCES